MYVVGHECVELGAMGCDQDTRCVLHCFFNTSLMFQHQGCRGRGGINPLRGCEDPALPFPPLGSRFTPHACPSGDFQRHDTSFTSCACVDPSFPWGDGIIVELDHV
jgi:hypothetical protein